MDVSTDPRLRHAAVLVPLYRDPAGRLMVVLIRRTEGGIHGGQLAFPGGQRDAADVTLFDTALRESHEEIGLEPDAVTALAELPTVSTRVSGFLVHPFLGRIRRPEVWRPDAREIAEVIEVPLTDLTRPGAHATRLERFEGWPEPIRIDFYHVGEHRLWGVSYHILHPLLPRLSAGEWAV
jgi:8-oxo-dGTP pyrophosphatase MutT (NUDIX family)